MRCRPRLALFLAVLLVFSPFAADADVLQHVEFKAGNTPIVITDKATELEIDSVLRVDIDEANLIREVGALSSSADQGTDLLARIQAIEMAIPKVILVQQKLIETKAAAVKLIAAEMAAGSVTQQSIQALDADLERLRVDFGAEARSAIQQLRPLRASDPELYQDIANAILVDYAAMADVLREHVQRVDQELARKVAEGPKVGVLVAATLVDSTGKETALHLDGYDTIAVGSPTPFPRFRLAPSERARAELAAAAALAPLVDRLVNDGGSAFQEAIDELETAIEGLPDKLGLDDRLQELETLAEALEQTGEQDLQPFVERVGEVRAQLDALSNAGIPASGNILEFVEGILKLAEDLKALREDLPATLKDLQNSLLKVVGDRFPGITTQAKTTLGGLQETLLANSETLKTFRDEIMAAVKTLRATEGLSNAAEAASRRARDLGADVPLDTSLDLQTIDAERHPGDFVHLTIQVEQVDPATGKSTSLLQGRQTFRLETYGWWMDTRGALLMVEPQGEIERELNYQPVPGLGYFWRYGAKNRPFLNHDLALGLGVSFALLDFQDSDNFEVGIAASATFLRELLWVGYGRNLQAKSEYFFVGINPITLSALFRR